MFFCGHEHYLTHQPFSSIQWHSDAPSLLALSFCCCSILMSLSHSLPLVCSCCCNSCTSTSISSSLFRFISLSVCHHRQGAAARSQSIHPHRVCADDTQLYFSLKPDGIYGLAKLRQVRQSKKYNCKLALKLQFVKSSQILNVI